MLETVLTPGKALVRCEDDQSVIELSGLFQRSDQLPDPVVQALDGLLVSPRTFEEFATHRRTLHRVVLTIVASSPGLSILDVLRLARTRPFEVVGEGDRRVLGKEPLMARSWGEWAMASGVAEPEKPGFVRIPALSFQIIDGPFSVVVGRISFDQLFFSTLKGNQLVVVVGAGVLGELRPIPDDLEIPIPSISCIRARMPLADLSGRVACLFERAHPKWSFFDRIRPWIVSFHPHGLDAVGEFSG